MTDENLPQLQASEVREGDRVRTLSRDLWREGVVAEIYHDEPNYTHLQTASKYALTDHHTTKILLVNRPKPKEPVAFGAVIKAKTYPTGTKYYFTRVDQLVDSRSWYRAYDGTTHYWAELVEIEILSEGIKAV